MTGRNSVDVGTGRKLSSVLLFVIGTMASLATVFGFFGATWWGWDRLADWRLPLLVILVITSVVYGFVFRRALSGVFLFAAIVNAVLVAPLWLSTQATAESSDRIRIVSLDASGSGDNRKEIALWIDSVEADVVLLYRTSPDWTATLTAADVPYRIVSTPVGSDAVGHTTVLARGDTSVAPLDPVPGSDVTIRVGLADTQAIVVGLAVQNPGSTLLADYRIDRFASVNAAVSELLEPVVITGNLETSRWSHAFEVIAQGMTNSEDGFGYSATWPSTDWPIIGEYMGLPLDHALYRGDITVPSRRVGPDLGPAHRPLLFDLSAAAG